MENKSIINEYIIKIPLISSNRILLQYALRPLTNSMQFILTLYRGQFPWR